MTTLNPLASVEGQNAIATAIRETGTNIINAGVSAQTSATAAATSANSAAESATAAATSATAAASSVTQTETIKNEMLASYGYPFTAATASAMTDTTKIYVYTGSETGYINGNWYYYDGTAWVSGGVYNAIAFNTDPTLTVEGDAADAKVTGQIISDVDGVEIIQFQNGFIATNGATVDITDVGISTSSCYAVESTTAGEVFTVNGHGSSTSRLWCFIDSAGNSLAVADANITGTNLVIIAPADADKLVLNCRISDRGMCYRGKKITDHINLLSENCQDKYNDILNTEPIADATYQGIVNIADPSNLESGGYTASGAKNTSATATRNKDFIHVKPNTKYIVEFVLSSNVSTYALSYDKDKNLISRGYTFTKINGSPVIRYAEINTGDNIEYLNFYCAVVYDSQNPVKVMLYESESGSYSPVFVGYVAPKNRYYTLPHLVQDSFEKVQIPQILNIAYSLIGIAPINTLEHYLSVPKLGFNCIKGDVRLTSDNKLVMCHDAGFTLNSSGRITTYDSNNATAIHDMTEAEVLALEHSTYRDQLGYYAHPCTLEDMLIVCQESGLTPFITLRDEYISTIVPLVFALLEKYGLTNKSIINSFTFTTLEACREQNASIMLSWVQDGNTPLSNALVDTAKTLGNCVISLQSKDWSDQDVQDAYDYAMSMGVGIYTAINYNYTDYIADLKQGVTGQQIGRMIMTYSPTLYAFRVTVVSGVITFSDFYNGSRYTATIGDHLSSGAIYISAITENGTNRGFADGIMPAWMNGMPYELQIKEDHGYDCSIRWAHKLNVNRFVIECEELKTVDCAFSMFVRV